MAQITREARIYLALWRKALKSSTVISVKCPNLSSAVAMRQGMYRAIRPFRSGQGNDEELLKASEMYVLYLVQADKASDPHFIQFRERKSLQILDEMWDTLGLDEEDLFVGDERATLTKLEELLENNTKPSTTPFYERD